MASSDRNKNKDGLNGSPKRGQGDGQEQIQTNTEEESIPIIQGSNVFNQRGPQAPGVNTEQPNYLLILVMLIARNATQNEKWLQRLQQENRNHQQRVQEENQKQLQRLIIWNRNHQQWVQKENQEQLQRQIIRNRNHQQRVQEENKEQLQRLIIRNRNHQQWVQKENQEQLQRLKQENRNHLQWVQEENQEQLQRIKKENRNHHLQMQSEKQNQLNQMHQENQEHLEQQLRQLRQELMKDLQLKQKENLDIHKPLTANSFVMAPHWKQGGGQTDYSEEGEGDICCMCRKCKCCCHIHDKSTHEKVKDKHKLAGTMGPDTGHHRMVPRDKDIDTHVSIEESRYAGRNGITGKVVTSSSATNGVSDSDVPKGESNGSTKKTHQYPYDGMSVACGGNPGDPSDSDGSDSEDDSKKDHAKDDRDETDQNRDRNRESNISDWRIDTEVWKRCIEMKDEEEATRLVNDGILPDQDLLDRASEVFDVSSKIVQNICTAICCYMKNKMLHINRVWPALDYRHECPKKIFFIIYTSQPLETETIEYRYYDRPVNEISTSCSNENSDIKELEQNCEKDYSETEKIRECLGKYSKSLMKRHKNLTRISISWFKSRGYGTEKKSITRKTCIALYVQVKGFVPLNETDLPNELDGIVVDVREGVVTSYIGPNEHHVHLKMGCAVHSGLKDSKENFIGGTLGGFFEINKAVYCISCAHVFLSPADMEKMKNIGICDLANDTTIRRFNARQPVCNGSRPFGIGVRAVYKEGGDGETGAEVVIVEVTDRFPISGDFPDCPHNRNTECDSLTFSSGKICDREDVNRLIREKKLTVVKFGCLSGWTRGSLRLESGSARLRHLVGTIDDGTDEFGLLLHNQYEIESIGGIPFAINGDSGALVFTDANGPLSVIGIVEGGMGKEVVYVTPICEVFAALNLQDQVQNMKIFPPDRPDIQNIPMQTDDSNSSQYLINRSDSGILSADGTTLCNVQEKLTTLEQDLPKEIEKHAHAIKDDVNTITQEFVPVKSELNSLKSNVSVLNADITNVKTEVENTKRDLKHEIDKSKNELQNKMNAMQEQMQEQMKEHMKEHMKQQTELLQSFFAQFSPPSPATSTSNTHPS